MSTGTSSSTARSCTRTSSGTAKCSLERHLVLRGVTLGRPLVPRRVPLGRHLVLQGVTLGRPLVPRRVPLGRHLVLQGVALGRPLVPRSVPLERPVVPREVPLGRLLVPRGVPLGRRMDVVVTAPRCPTARLTDRQSLKLAAVGRAFPP